MNAAGSHLYFNSVQVSVYLQSLMTAWQRENVTFELFMASKREIVSVALVVSERRDANLTLSLHFSVVKKSHMNCF